VLPFAIAVQRLEAVPRRDAQIVQGNGSVEKAKLDQASVCDLGRQPPRSDASPEVLLVRSAKLRIIVSGL